VHSAPNESGSWFRVHPDRTQVEVLIAPPKLDTRAPIAELTMKNHVITTISHTSLKLFLRVGKAKTSERRGIPRAGGH
jgi:hypothetical protein